MPINPTYPGVYIQELPSGTRTIVGVSTSVTAFIGFFRKGPMNQPLQIFNIGDFERLFGGLDDRSEAGYAIQQFFANDGEIAWVVRTASGACQAAQVTVLNKAAADGAPVFTVAASSPGVWGNQVRVDVDYDTKDPEGLFNLTATEYSTEDGQLTQLNTQTYRNLSMDPMSASYAVAVLQQTEGPVVLANPGVGLLPAPTGLTGAAITDPVNTIKGTMTAMLNGQPLTPDVNLANPVDDLYDLPGAVQGALRALPELKSAAVQVVGQTLNISLADPQLSDVVLTFQGNLASLLQLSGTGVVANVQSYALGSGVSAGAQTGGVAGADGTIPGAAELLGNPSKRTGLYSLDTVDLFNILCIPSLRGFTDANAYTKVVQDATAYCQDRRAFLIVDLPASVQTARAAQAWIAQNASLASPDAAAYFPAPMIPDPLNDYRLRAVAPSGTLAGLYSRTDASRGVWKAPAGVDAALKGVTALQYKLTDAENGTLNPLGLNALRNFPVYANVAWGARTLYGNDARGSEWKYVPVRRLALYIEESLYRGIQWAVFEPNDEVLWSQLRLNIGAFLHNLFTQQAFAGSTPQQAYFVNCDASTTSAYDIERGIVNVVVGFAPVKPAEFVILTIEQMAGQTET